MDMADEQSYDFDVAVSFAGENRSYVEGVVRGLNPDQVSVFYDDDHKVEMWGQDLVEYFTNLYQHRARYVVMFISTHYAEKMWTTVERRSALARAITQRGPYILPVRLDDTELDGLLPTVSYLDARLEGLKGIIDAIHKKLGADRVPTPESYGGRVPRSPEELQQLLELRPDFWEYWLYAGVLKSGLDALEGKYRDYEMGFAKQTGQAYNGRDAFEFLRSVPTNAANLVASFNAVVQPEVQARAFGEPGEPGDPERITHMAKRLIDVYEGLMDEATRLLGSSVPEEFRKAQQAGAKFGRPAVEQIRAFVVETVDTMDRLPEIVAGRSDDEEPMHLTLGITITADEEVTGEFIEGLSEGLDSLM
jgi:hypothetical protein